VPLVFEMAKARQVLPQTRVQALAPWQNRVGIWNSGCLDITHLLKTRSSGYRQWEKRMRSGKVARALSSKIRSASLLADMPLWHYDIGSHVRAKAAYDRPASAVSHCDICATANAASDAVRGWHRDCHWDHQQIMDNEMQGSYSGLSTCS
jgi:hypothetical protein